MVFFYIISELPWQCGIFLHDFWIALTVLYVSSCICTSPGKWTVMYLCVRSIGVCISSRVLLHDFGIVLTVWYFFTWFQNYSDSVVFFDIISELFWQCGIFLHNFWTVLTVWYFSTWLRNCSESVVFFDMISELFWQCGIFRHDFGIVLTV